MPLYPDAQLLGTFNSKNDRDEQVSMNVYSFVAWRRQECQNVSIRSRFYNFQMNIK